MNKVIGIWIVGVMEVIFLWNWIYRGRPDIEVNTILFEARLCEVLEKTMLY